MTDPTPIREGVSPEFDLERELIDFCQIQINRFKEGAKVPPTRIAVALMGKGDDGKFHSRVNTWDTKEEHCKLENCSAAAALFLDRAIGD